MRNPISLTLALSAAILAPLTSLTLSSCSGQSVQPTETTFVIEGTAHYLAEGDTIILADLVNNMPIPVVSTTVDANGHFLIVSDAAQAHVSFLYHPDSFAYQLIVENNTRTAVVIPSSPDSLLTVTEGLQNQEFYRLMRAQADAMSQIESLIPEDFNAGQPLAPEVEDSIEAISNRLVDNYIATMKSHVPSALSDVILMQIHQTMDPDTLNAVLDIMEAHEPHYPGYLQIREHITRQAKTNPGQPFIPISQPDAQGNLVDLADIVKKSRLTLLDFWASWCAPCRAEMPTLVQANKLFAKKGLTIVSVSLDADAQKWQDAIKSLNMDWLNISDLKAWDNVAADAYNVEAIPSSFLISADGTILAKNLRGQELIDTIQEYLDK